MQLKKSNRIYWYCLALAWAVICACFLANVQIRRAGLQGRVSEGEVLLKCLVAASR